LGLQVVVSVLVVLEIQAELFVLEQKELSMLVEQEQQALRRIPMTH